MVVVIVALLAAETLGVSKRKAAIAGLAMSAISGFCDTGSVLFTGVPPPAPTITGT